MNVLAVLPQYPPRSRVGAWITTHEYLKELAARGHDVHVLCLMSSQPSYDFEGVHVHPRQYKDYATPDLVVSHLGDNQEGARYAERVEVPSVRLVHGLHRDNAARLDQTPTALAIFSSRALANDTHWPGHQIIAHPPVHPEQYRTELVGQHVTLSNLSHDKGGPILRVIAQRLHTLAFLGVKGSWGRQVDNMPPNVEVIDPVTDMRDVYRRTRILLMPSARESYGRVGLEAACSGIPTIAHPSPGLQEAMGDSAVWVDREDIGGWVRAITQLEDRERWLQASESALECSRLLTPDQTIETVCDAIESLVGAVIS